MILSKIKSYLNWNFFLLFARKFDSWCKIMIWFRKNVYLKITSKCGVTNHGYVNNERPVDTSDGASGSNGLTKSTKPETVNYTVRFEQKNKSRLHFLQLNKLLHVLVSSYEYKKSIIYFIFISRAGCAQDIEILQRKL